MLVAVRRVISLDLVSVLGPVNRILFRGAFSAPWPQSITSHFVFGERLKWLIYAAFRAAFHPYILAAVPVGA